MLKWSWAVLPPIVLSFLCYFLQPALMFRTSEDFWVTLAIAGFALEGVLAMWAGWRIARLHPGGLWAAAAGGAATQVASWSVIVGLAWSADARLSASGQHSSTLDIHAVGGFVIFGVLAAACGVFGNVVARFVEHRHAT